MHEYQADGCIAARRYLGDAVGMAKRSKVHPSHKTLYRVTNWSEYDRGLMNRGSLTVWVTPAALAAWTPRKSGRRGGQRRYSDAAIELAVQLRLVFSLPWRQTEGLLRSVIGLLGLELDVPDHTTLSRRSRLLRIRPRGGDDGLCRAEQDAGTRSTPMVRENSIGARIYPFKGLANM